MTENHIWGVVGVPGDQLDEVHASTDLYFDCTSPSPYIYAFHLAVSSHYLRRTCPIRGGSGVLLMKKHQLTFHVKPSNFAFHKARDRIFGLHRIAYYTLLPVHGRSQTGAAVRPINQVPALTAYLIALAIASLVNAAEAAIPIALPYGDTLLAGQFLLPKQGLISLNGYCTLVLQADGNLVEYLLGTSSTWAAETADLTISHATLQPNGIFGSYGDDVRDL